MDVSTNDKKRSYHIYFDEFKTKINEPKSKAQNCGSIEKEEKTSQIKSKSCSFGYNFYVKPLGLIFSLCGLCCSKETFIEREQL